MQCRVLELEISLTHRAFHSCDRMAHHAAEAGLARGRIFNFADRTVKHAAVEQRGIVASGAPLRRFYSDGVLHVLEALAIPSIVEGRKMVRRTLPFLVNVCVAALAGIGFGKIIRGNLPAVGRLGGTRKKRTARAIAFAVHGSRRDRRILDPVTAFPGSGPYPASAENNQTCRK